MSDALTTILATVGATLSVSSNIPQVYRAWKDPRKRSTDDISPLSTFIHVLAAACWAAYGFYLNLWILGVESFIVFLCWMLIMCAIIKDTWFLQNE